MIEATEARGRIWLRTPFALKDSVKALPGARWDKGLKRWHIPATPHAAGSLRALCDAVGGVDADATVRALFDAHAVSAGAQRFKTCPIDDVPVVDWLRTDPWEHQRRAIQFALSQKACLFYCHMGTGKTLMSIGVVDGMAAGVALVLCPKAVIPVWQSEFKKHSARSVSVLELTKGTSAKKAADLGAFLRYPDPGVVRVVVVNYESAWRAALAKEITAQQWDCVILDEVHKIKSPGSKVSKFCAKLRNVSRKILGASGTPMSAGPLDVYGSFRALDPGIFGTSFARFRNRYGVMGGFQNKQVLTYQNLDELSAKMDQITFRAGQDVLDLPDEVDVDRFVILDDKEKKFYDEIKEDLCADLEEGEVTAANALVKLLKLQQATGGFAMTDDGQHVELGTSRRRALVDVLEDIAPDEAVVVFCKFVRDLDSVHAAAAALDRESLELSGRRNELAQWQGEGADLYTTPPPPILAVQIQAGGVGVSLVRSRFAVWYSTGFSLADVQQARARVYRPGQGRNVTNVHLIARGTVDTAIRRALQKKTDVIEEVLNDLT